MHRGERCTVLQRAARVRQGDVVFPQTLDQEFVHFEEGEVAADAEMAATAQLINHKQVSQYMSLDRVTIGPQFSIPDAYMSSST